MNAELKTKNYFKEIKTCKDCLSIYLTKYKTAAYITFRNMCSFTVKLFNKYVIASKKVNYLYTVYLYINISVYLKI